MNICEHAAENIDRLNLAATSNPFFNFLCGAQVKDFSEVFSLAAGRDLTRKNARRIMDLERTYSEVRETSFYREGLTTRPTIDDDLEALGLADTVRDAFARARSVLDTFAAVIHALMVAAFASLSTVRDTLRALAAQSRKKRSIETLTAKAGFHPTRGPDVLHIHILERPLFGRIAYRIA